MTTLLLGVGHPDRADDSAGLLVVDLLATLPDVVARSVEADPSDLLTDPLWDDADQVVIVDTVRTGAPAGTVFRWDTADLLDLLPTAVSGAHDLGIAMTIRLADALGRLPRALTVYGIEGVNFETGEPPSHEVLAAAQEVATTLEITIGGTTQAARG